MHFQGHMFAERTKKSGQPESAVVVPGSLLGCAAYLSSTKTRAIIRTAEPCKLVAFGPHELEKLLVTHQPLGYVADCCALFCLSICGIKSLPWRFWRSNAFEIDLTSTNTVYVVMLQCLCLSFLCYFVPTFTAKLDSKDEGKHAWLLQGRNDVAFQQTCMAAYGCEGDKKATDALIFLSPLQPYVTMHVG